VDLTTLTPEIGVSAPCDCDTSLAPRRREVITVSPSEIFPHEEKEDVVTEFEKYFFLPS
jgi:hypothetical protein